MSAVTDDGVCKKKAELCYVLKSCQYEVKNFKRTILLLRTKTGEKLISYTFICDVRL